MTLAFRPGRTFILPPVVFAPNLSSPRPSSCHLTTPTPPTLVPPPGAESHFNVLIVSNAFEGKKLIERHRLVNTVLRDERDGLVHALSLQTKTVQQWSADPTMAGTPNCMGGSKH